MPPNATGPRADGQSANRLRAWLIERVATYLRRSPDEIDPAVPLPEYGLDSMYAMTICGDIEDEFQIPVNPTVIWDNPSIDALSAALSVDADAR